MKVRTSKDRADVLGISNAEAIGRVAGMEGVKGAMSATLTSISSYSSTRSALSTRRTTSKAQAYVAWTTSARETESAQGESVPVSPCAAST